MDGRDLLLMMSPGRSCYRWNCLSLIELVPAKLLLILGSSSLTLVENETKRNETK